MRDIDLHVQEFDVEALGSSRKHLIWKAVFGRSSEEWASPFRRVLAPLVEGSRKATVFEADRFLRHKHSEHFQPAAAAALGKQVASILWAPKGSTFHADPCGARTGVPREHPRRHELALLLPYVFARPSKDVKRPRVGK